MVKVYPVHENAHIQMYLLLPLLNLMDVNVITYVCLFVILKIPLQSGVQQNQDIPHGFSWKCLMTISADSSGDTANDQVLTEFIPFSELCVGVKSVIDQTWIYNLDLQVYANKSQTYAILATRYTNHFQN